MVGWAGARRASIRRLHFVRSEKERNHPHGEILDRPSAALPSQGPCLEPR